VQTGTSVEEENPVKYAMLICGDEERYSAVDEATAEKAMKEVYAWFERWGQAGKIASGGAELESVHTARTVRAGVDGAPVVTDGPYLELKEVIGGVVFLEATDMDDAMAVACTWPWLPYGAALEVRPVIPH
jgi:hypothetical protein